MLKFQVSSTVGQTIYVDKRYCKHNTTNNRDAKVTIVQETVTQTQSVTNSSD